MQQRSTRRAGREAPRSERPTKEHVAGVIADIGEKANVIVRRADKEKGIRIKFAKALHDLRRGCASVSSTQASQPKRWESGHATSRFCNDGEVLGAIPFG